MTKPQKTEAFALPPGAKRKRSGPQLHQCFLGGFGVHNLQRFELGRLHSTHSIRNMSFLEHLFGLRKRRVGGRAGQIR